jgi:hypothetical protein
MKLLKITREEKSDIYIPIELIDSFSISIAGKIRINFTRPVKITGFRRAEFIEFYADQKTVDQIEKLIY